MKGDLIEIKTISQLYSSLKIGKPGHPLVSILHHEHFDRESIQIGIRYSLNLFAITLKSGVKGSFQYGRNTYDYDEGTLLFTSPGQILETGEKNYTEKPDGWTLYFHPDLIRHSDLGGQMENYTYFSYGVTEALHISSKEKSILSNTIHTIESEYSQNLDKHSQKLIVANIQLLLDYCTRFYDRQFYLRTNLNKDILTRFESLLVDYYNSDSPLELGIPSVKYCADQLNLSANYLSDLLKKETQRNARETIHQFIVEKAKNSLLNSSDPISQIAYSLGFEYPSHFNKVFKAKTGVSPSEFRKMG